MGKLKRKMKHKKGFPLGNLERKFSRNYKRRLKSKVSFSSTRVVIHGLK